ncbi:MAG TPA: hypothetical protein VJB12_02705, partial [Candidatus Nanoarchaeia archaeon]|nr:hypothetical protein [Candidatus Nanoarchaeia archaeon]
MAGGGAEVKTMRVSENFLREVNVFVESHKEGASQRVLIRSAAIKNQEKTWTNVLTTLKILKEGEEVNLREDIQYDIFFLKERVIS